MVGARRKIIVRGDSLHLQWKPRQEDKNVGKRKQPTCHSMKEKNATQQSTGGRLPRCEEMDHDQDHAGRCSLRTAQAHPRGVHVHGIAHISCVQRTFVFRCSVAKQRQTFSGRRCRVCLFKDDLM